MSKNSIKNHCTKVNKLFVKALENDPIEAALLLGNCLLLEKNADEFSLKPIQDTINKATKRLTPLHIHKIWQAITLKLSKHAKLIDVKTLKSLEKVQEWFLCTTDILKHLDKSLLLAHGQNVSHYRFVLIALIRQSLIKNNLKDPFAEGFSYALLKQGSVEQNYLYTSNFIKQCAHLPVEQIVALGSKNSHIAGLLLQDLVNHPQFYEISSHFAKIFPDLRQKIANIWREALENYPLTQIQKKELKPLLEKCQKEFPEFTQLSTEGRIARDTTTIQIPVQTNYFDYILYGIAIPSVFLRGSKAITHAASIYHLGAALLSGAGILPAAASVCTTAIPVALPIVGIGTTLWLSHRYRN